jgi:hypothetical protein
MCFDRKRRYTYTTLFLIIQNLSVVYLQVKKKENCNSENVNIYKVIYIYIFTVMGS